MADNDAQRCLCCRNQGLQEIECAEELGGVTSDAKPWPRSGRFAVCRSCGHIQKYLDASWQRDAALIYSDYDIYQLSGGAEQLLFRDGGKVITRSARVVEQLAATVELPASGRMLDVGCGKGAFVTAFSREFPGWELAGAEQDGRFEEAVRAIPGVTHFYSGDIAAIGERFDLITLMHVLEHIPDPVNFLSQLKDKLTPNGMILVQVPNVLANPFDLLVADHSSHFAPQTLAEAARQASCEIVSLATDWVAKELSLVLRRNSVGNSASRAATDTTTETSVRASLVWLGSVLREGKHVMQGESAGIFGTSIAGTWLAGQLKDDVRFFVDEDASRIGKRHLGSPVLHPEQVSARSRVYLPLPPFMGEALARRMKGTHPTVDWLLPTANLQAAA